MIFSKNLFLVPPQLALPVEFLFEILCVGAPPTCIVCRNCCSNFSMLGARQYNTVGPEILIYVSGSNPKIFIIYLYNLSPFDAITC